MTIRALGIGFTPENFIVKDVFNRAAWEDSRTDRDQHMSWRSSWRIEFTR